MIKRYALFSGNRYYPLGGILDLRDVYETLEEAMQAGTPLMTSDDDDWMYVADLETLHFVAVYDCLVEYHGIDSLEDERAAWSNPRRWITTADYAVAQGRIDNDNVTEVRLRYWEGYDGRVKNIFQDHRGIVDD